MITITIRNHIFDYDDQTVTHEYVPGQTLFDYLAHGNIDALDKLFDVLNTKYPKLTKLGVIKFIYNLDLVDPPDKIKNIIPKDGDTLTILLVPKDFVSAILVPLIIGIVLSSISMGISYLLMPKPSPPVTSNEDEMGGESPTYNWEGPTTSYALGRPVPLIYGTHMTGGSFINAMVEGLPYGYDNSWGTPEGRVSSYEYYRYQSLTDAGGESSPGDITESGEYNTWWDRPNPMTHVGAYFSNLYKKTTFLGLTYPNLNLSINTEDGRVESNVLPMYVNAYRGRCLADMLGNRDQEKGQWMFAWKLMGRLLTYDFSNIVNPATIRTGIGPSIVSGWQIIDRDYVGNDWSSPDFSAWGLDGSDHPLPSPVWDDDYSELFPAATGVSAGDRVWIELMLEAACVHLYDNKDSRGSVAIGCRPKISNIEYKYYGLVDEYKTLEKTYSLADGLRMLIAISSGEVCSIGNIAGLGTDTDLIKAINITINDTPVDDLFSFPDVAGYTAPFEVQTSRGANYPVIRFAEGQDSYANLFNKRQLNTTNFDWLIPSELQDDFYFRYTTPTTCSAIDVVFNFKSGLYEFHQKDGVFRAAGMHPDSEFPDGPSIRRLWFYIEYFPEGAEASKKWWTHSGPASTKAPFMLADKRDEAFKMVVRIGNDVEPLPSHQYSLIIYREYEGLTGEIVTGDADNKVYVYDEFHVCKVSEYGFEMLRYPNTALLGLRILPTDKLSGATPKISVLVEGRYIKVPILRRTSDYSVVMIQRTYTVYDSDTGIWTWKESEISGAPDPDTDETLEVSPTEYMWQFCSNPAFIIYDLLTSQELYPYMPEDYIVWQDFITAGAFCWEMLSTSTISGKQERRFVCNLVIDGEIDAANLLNQISNMFRLKILWIGNRLRLKILKPELPTQKFTNANILPDSYQESYQQFGKILNTLEVSFYNEQNYFKQEVVQVTTKDTEASKKRIVKQTYSLIGTTKLGQAMRISKYLLAYAVVSDKAIQFKTTLQGLACLPGDVVRIQHSAMSYGYSGHLRSDPVAGTYYLDREIYLPLSKVGDYRFEVQKESTRAWGTDTVNFNVVDAPHTIDSISGVTLIDADSLPVTVTKGDVWQLVPMSGSTAYPKDVRVTQITTNLDKNECQIEAEPYIESIYSEDPLEILKPYIPPAPPPQATFPPDVANLSLTQIQDEYNIKVTYSAPYDETVSYFLATITSVTDHETSDGYYLYYDSSINDSQITTTETLKVYNSSGIYKGEMLIGEINTLEDYVFAAPSEDTFTPVIDDVVSQERTVLAGQQIHHTNIYMREADQTFSLHGTDYSGGAGYLINLSSSYVGKTIWVRVQAVSPFGALSINPPTAFIKITVDRCLPSPSHLSMCSVGDGQATFTGCDVCVSWQEVSSFQGAGMGEDAAAGDRADITGDFRITGHTVWIYNNTISATPMLLRSLTGYTDTEYEYSHNMNKEDQYRFSGREGKGYRDLRFEVYQEDTYGNVSCNPASIQLSNAAPDMSAFTPHVVVNESSIAVDWTGFVNNPTQMPEDVLGWEVWYGTTGSNMTFIDVPDSTQGTVMITGVSAGTYTVYVVPYDCFGTGTPRATYASQSVYVIVEGTTLPTYIPAKPEGMAAGLIITGVTDLVTHYLIECTASLESHGFDNTITSEGAYAASTFATNYIYYNAHPGDDYCYVTASNLNTENTITAMWWNTITLSWNIKIPVPLSATLDSYGYTVAQGVPVVGQTFSINVWAGLSIEEGGGIWGGGLGSTLYMRWFAPNLNSTVQRLSHFSFNIRNGDTGTTAKEHSVGVDKNLADNGYYNADVENLPPANSLSLSAVLWSNSGDQSESLTVGTLYVVVEVLSDSPPVDASFTAVADTEGRNVQFTINNWEGIWNLATVKHFEFFVHPAHYTFATDTWSIPTALTDLIDGTYEAKPYEEEEFVEETHDKIRAKIDGSYLHVFAGSSDAPVWQWTNEVCTDEGGVCTYDNGTLCTAGFVAHYEQNDCPYGFSSDGSTTCTYVSAGTGCSRVLDTVSYNQYYVAVAVRHLTGMLQFISWTETDGTEHPDIFVALASLELINWMHIGNASITTAKIGDLAVNNAKIRNIAAQKMWIGDPANEFALPFTGHCAYDKGDGCAWATCREGDTGCPYRTTHPTTGVGCPNAEAYAFSAACNYVEQEFAITRLFDLYGTDPADNREYTFINAGFLMTDTVKARSLQIGVLDYVLDLEATRVYYEDVVDTSATVKWHKGGQADTDGHIKFSDSQGFYIIPGIETFEDDDFPDGVDGNIIKMHVAGFLYINAADGSRVTLEFRENPVVGVVQDWDIEAGFTRMRDLGFCPIFAVIITHHPGGLDPSDGSGDVFIGGIGSTTAEDVINSTVGQFKVDIVWTKATVGTYIKNNDITTGVIHNPTWTSFIDMRHYSSYDASVSYKGHGRLAIDAPSSLYERSVSSLYGDQYGKEWWNFLASYPDAYGTDTKLIIGRPYIDGFENALIESGLALTPGDERLEAETLGDEGYLWFYRTYYDDPSNPKMPPTWVGTLEIGGRLRIKNLITRRETLVGLEYEESGLTWQRVSAPGLHIYDTEEMINNGGAPELLVTLGGEVPTTVLDIYTTANYFNTSTTGTQGRDFTVCIDIEGQIPVDSFTDWGRASLLVVPPTGTVHPYATGILVRATAAADDPDRSRLGVRIVGNYESAISISCYGALTGSDINRGIYAYVENDAIAGRAYGIHTYAFAASAGGRAEGGEFIGAAVLGGGNATGCIGHGLASGIGSVGIGGAFYATGSNAETNIGVYIDSRAYAGTYAAHIRFNGQRSGGMENPPLAAEGSVGDLIVSEKGLWYKATPPHNWRYVQWA